MTRRAGGAVVTALIVGALLGAMLPTSAHHGGVRAKIRALIRSDRVQRQQLEALKGQVRHLAHTVVRHKTVFTTRASTTTLDADPDLQMPVDAGETWIVHGTLDLSTDSATPDANVRLTAPDGSTVWGAAYVSEANGTSVTTKDGGGPHYVPMEAFSTGKVDFFVKVTVGSTSGTFAVEWAQNTADPVPVRMTSSSFFVARQVPPS